MSRTYAPNRIKELRKDRRLTQKDIADALEAIGGAAVTFGTIAKLENSSMALSLDYLLGIARVLNVTPAELISDREMGAREIPVLGAVAAGNWREAIHDAKSSIPVPASLPGNNLFALDIEGDSMDLIVPDGGKIVVNPDDLDLVNNKVYVAANSQHDTTFKRFSLNPPRLLPVSSNAAHEPIVIGHEPFVTIGRVVYALFPL